VLGGTPIERTAAAMREPYLSKGPTRQGPDWLSLNEFPSLSKESIRNEINYTIDTIPTATEARCGRMSVTDDVQLCKACPRPYLA